MIQRPRARGTSLTALRITTSFVGVLVAAAIIALWAACSDTGRGPKEDKSDQIISFRGTVISLAPTPGVGSGIVAVYQLAKYRLDHLCGGRYEANEIIVDHLILTGTELESIKVGDAVCVLARRSVSIPDRWNYPGIREKTDAVEAYYVGESVRLRSDSGCECQ